jgi:DNA replication protein DnaC
MPTLQSNQSDRLLSYGILQKWHDSTWDDFTNDPEAKKRLKGYLAKIREARKDGVGLYLYGANGTGKTLALNLLMKDLLAMKYSVRIYSLSTLITKFTAGWYDANEKKAFQALLQSVDFLGIEEIGKEFKAGANELGVMVLDHVIRYRLQMLLPVFATSNTSPKEIKSVYTEDLASMLREACMPLNIQGVDMREVVAAKHKKKYGWT